MFVLQDMLETVAMNGQAWFPVITLEKKEAKPNPKLS